MENKVIVMQTPSQQLASKVIERLLVEKILAPKDSVKTSALLSEGKLTMDDWRLLLELNEAEKEKS